MKRKMNHWTRRLLAAAMTILLLAGLAPTDMNRAEAGILIPTLKVQAHVQKKGWLGTVTGGKTAGTTGKSLRLEAIKLTLAQGGNSKIQYCAHVAGIGWQDWVSSGQVAGTTGKSKAIEAVRVKLTGGYQLLYDVYYRVHVARGGWLGWAKNGQIAGSTGMSLRVEAIQVKVVSKLTKVKDDKRVSMSKPKLTFQGHSQSLGWTKAVGDGGIVGVTGKSKRLEALVINLKDFDGKSNGVRYSAYVDGEWQKTKVSGETAGTTGKSKPIEAVKISLAGDLGTYFNICYRAHVQNIGWMGWAMNGEKAGTTGANLRMEAIQIRLVPKDQDVSRGGAAYMRLTKTKAITLRHNMRVGLHQSVSGPCAAYAYAFGLSIVTGGAYNPNDFYYADPGGSVKYAHYTRGHAGSYEPFDRNKVYEALKQGRPTMVHLYAGGGNQHWVLINGVRGGAIAQMLQDSDFTVLDSGYGDQRKLTSALCYGAGNIAGMKIMY